VDGWVQNRKAGRQAGRQAGGQAGRFKAGGQALRQAGNLKDFKQWTNNIKI
jgi:hypothetical protein